MASPINCLSILVIPLLVTSLFYQVSAEEDDDAFFRTVCQKTKDPGFCFSTLKAEPRASAGEGLAKVSIVIVIDTVQVIVDQIPGILQKLGDRLDKTRMENCQYDFNEALVISRKAFLAAASKSYDESTSLIINVANKLEACDNSYKIPPVRVSPISDASTKVLKKTDIAIAVIDTISG